MTDQGDFKPQASAQTTLFRLCVSQCLSLSLSLSLCVFLLNVLLPCARVLVNVLLRFPPIVSLNFSSFVSCCIFVWREWYCFCCCSPCCHETKTGRTSMDRTFSDEASLVNTSVAWIFMGIGLKTQSEAQLACLKRPSRLSEGEHTQKKRRPRKRKIKTETDIYIYREREQHKIPMQCRSQTKVGPRMLQKNKMTLMNID